MSRTQRTAQFNNIVEKLWTQKFWDFIKDYSDKELFWEGISKNPNITWDIIKIIQINLGIGNIYHIIQI